ncbi:tetratricopeptide repeat protein, partial [Candidatus Riflebacteria bacterium]
MSFLISILLLIGFSPVLQAKLNNFSRQNEHLKRSIILFEKNRITECNKLINYLENTGFLEKKHRFELAKLKGELALKKSDFKGALRNYTIAAQFLPDDEKEKGRNLYKDLSELSLKLKEKASFFKWLRKFLLEEGNEQVFHTTREMFNECMKNGWTLPGEHVDLWRKWEEGIFKNFPQLLLNRANSLFQNKNYQSTLLLLEKYAKVYEKFKEREIFLDLKVKALLKLEHTETAFILLEKISKQRKLPLMQYLKVKLALKKGFQKDFTKNLSSLMKNIETFPAEIKADCLRIAAFQFTRIGDWQKAGNYFQQLEKCLGGSLQGRDKLYGLLVELQKPKDETGKKPEEILKELEKLTNKGVREDVRKKALYQLGNWFFKGEDYRKSRLYLSRLLLEYKRREKPLYLLGRVEQNLKNFSAAREHFQEFILLFPDSAILHEVRSQLADCEENLGYFREALKNLKIVEKDAQENSALKLRIARVLALQGKTEKTEKVLKKLIFSEAPKAQRKVALKQLLAMKFKSGAYKARIGYLEQLCRKKNVPFFIYFKLAEEFYKG